MRQGWKSPCFGLSNSPNFAKPHLFYWYRNSLCHSSRNPPIVNVWWSMRRWRCWKKVPRRMPSSRKYRKEGMLKVQVKEVFLVLSFNFSRSYNPPPTSNYPIPPTLPVFKILNPQEKRGFLLWCSHWFILLVRE